MVFFFGFSGVWHPRLPEFFSLFAQIPLLIDLWIKECKILMKFYYFSWKWRRSPYQYLALNTNKTILEGVLFKYVWTNANTAGFKFFMTKHIVVLLIMDIKWAKSDVNGRKEKVCFWLLCIRKWQKKTNKCFKNI